MRRILATAALSLLLAGWGALPAQADRVGPFCFSVTPTPQFFFPDLLLEVFVDPEPYGQTHLGTARTLNIPRDSPSLVTLHVVGRFVRITIVGSQAVIDAKPSFILGGEIDTQAVPPTGPVDITIANAQIGNIVNNQLVPIGAVGGTITLVACP